MSDILANGQFGRDDDIKCECGGDTYLSHDDGYGLLSYNCIECDSCIGVQYEIDDCEEDYENYDVY